MQATTGQAHGIPSPIAGVAGEEIQKRLGPNHDANDQEKNRGPFPHAHRQTEPNLIADRPLPNRV